MARPRTTAAEYQAVTIRLPRDIMQRCQAEAARDERSLNFQIVRIMREWYERQPALGTSDEDKPDTTVTPAPTPASPEKPLTPADVTVTDQTEPPRTPRGQGTYFLGKLCKRRHDHEGTGQSLRRSPSGGCHQCNMEGQERRRQAHVRAKKAARPPLRIVEHP